MLVRVGVTNGVCVRQWVWVWVCGQELENVISSEDAGEAERTRGRAWVMAKASSGDESRCGRSRLSGGDGISLVTA